MSGARPFWLPAAPFLFLCLWSGGFGFGKLGLGHAGPYTFLCVRYAIVVAVLALAALYFRPAWPNRIMSIVHLTVVGLCIQAGYFGFTYTALAGGAAAGSVALITSLQPILVALIAPKLTGESVGLRQWLGLILGLTGAAIVILSRHGAQAEQPLMMLFAFGALASMTAATVYEKRFGGQAHPIAANLVQAVAGFIALLPLAWLIDDFAFDLHRDTLIALSYLVIGNSVIAISLLLTMIRYGEVARVSAWFFMVPPVAALIAFGVIGETLAPMAWLGMAVAAIGVALVVRQGSTGPAKPARAKPATAKEPAA
ncbi:MAG: DMT family transporter [Geminicoccaceae bacterium]